MASSQNSASTSTSDAEVIKSTKEISTGFGISKTKIAMISITGSANATKCTARATTICIEDQHRLRKFDINQQNYDTLTRKKLSDLVG
jgi:hypothetical protein